MLQGTRITRSGLLREGEAHTSTKALCLRSHCQGKHARVMVAQKLGSRTYQSHQAQCFGAGQAKTSGHARRQFWAQAGLSRGRVQRKAAITSWRHPRGSSARRSSTDARSRDICGNAQRVGALVDGANAIHIPITLWKNAHATVLRMAGPRPLPFSTVGVVRHGPAFGGFSPGRTMWWSRM